MAAPVLELAQAGDEGVFAELVAPYRRELHLQRYLMLGSVTGADDLPQETMVAAWRHRLSGKILGFAGAPRTDASCGSPSSPSRSEEWPSCRSVAATGLPLPNSLGLSSRARVPRRAARSVAPLLSPNGNDGPGER
ncbi:MAG: hypothetical protein ACYCST_19520 [Acidimicrobiales bacterium]